MLTQIFDKAINTAIDKIDLTFEAAERAAEAKKIAKAEAEAQAAAAAAQLARALPQRYEYHIVRVNCNERADAVVQADADKVINEWAARGWRLHTYSHVGLGSGSGAALTSHMMTNALNLVFEREVA